MFEKVLDACLVEHTCSCEGPKPFHGRRLQHISRQEPFCIIIRVLWLFCLIIIIFFFKYRNICVIICGWHHAPGSTFQQSRCFLYLMLFIKCHNHSIFFFSLLFVSIIIPVCYDYRYIHPHIYMCWWKLALHGLMPIVHYRSYVNACKLSMDLYSRLLRIKVCCGKMYIPPHPTHIHTPSPHLN